MSWFWKFWSDLYGYVIWYVILGSRSWYNQTNTFSETKSIVPEIQRLIDECPVFLKHSISVLKDVFQILNSNLNLSTKGNLQKFMSQKYWTPIEENAYSAQIIQLCFSIWRYAAFVNKHRLLVPLASLACYHGIMIPSTQNVIFYFMDC
jgi:hypothetical protein